MRPISPLVLYDDVQRCVQILNWCFMTMFTEFPYKRREALFGRYAQGLSENQARAERARIF